MTIDMATPIAWTGVALLAASVFMREKWATRVAPLAFLIHAASGFVVAATVGHAAVAFVVGVFSMFEMGAAAMFWRWRAR